jgi:hypothetical protein
MNSTDSDKKAAPALHRVQIVVKRWANCVQDGSGWLIDPAHLVAVNRALDGCIRFIESRTIPTLRPHERFISKATCGDERWLFDVNRVPIEADWPIAAGVMDAITVGIRGSRFQKVFGRELVSAWQALKEQWEAIIREAQSRLGDRFHATDFPRAQDLGGYFIAWGEYSQTQEIGSHKLLGRFSIFEPPEPPPPPPPDMFEVFKTTKKHIELGEQRRAGHITEQEYIDRVGKLFEN